MKLMIFFKKKLVDEGDRDYESGMKRIKKYVREQEQEGVFWSFCNCLMSPGVFSPIHTNLIN